MSAIDNARAAQQRLKVMIDRYPRDASPREIATEEALRSLIAENERLTAETDTERAVRVVDSISRTTGMSPEQVTSTINSIGRLQITEEMLFRAERAIHNLVEPGTPWESTTNHQRNLRRREAGAALEAALTIHTDGSR